MIGYIMCHCAPERTIYRNNTNKPDLLYLRLRHRGLRDVLQFSPFFFPPLRMHTTVLLIKQNKSKKGNKKKRPLGYCEIERTKVGCARHKGSSTATALERSMTLLKFSLVFLCFQALTNRNGQRQMARTRFCVFGFPLTCHRASVKNTNLLRCDKRKSVFLFYLAVIS